MCLLHLQIHHIMCNLCVYCKSFEMEVRWGDYQVKEQVEKVGISR